MEHPTHISFPASHYGKAAAGITDGYQATKGYQEGQCRAPAKTGAPTLPLQQQA